MFRSRRRGRVFGLVMLVNILAAGYTLVVHKPEDTVVYCFAALLCWGLASATGPR